MAFNLARHCLEATARARPDKTALIASGQRLAFGEIEDSVLRIAEGLRRRGVEPGDRVLLTMPHGPDYALTFFGTNAAGAVPVPASPLLTPPELQFLANDSASRLTLASLDDLLKSPRGGYAPTDAEDPAYLVYTSGTSGRPKGVLHAQRAILGRAPMREGWHGIAVEDVVLHTGALNWTYAMGVGLMDAWPVGATAVIHDGPRDIGVWQTLMRDHGVTVFASVPGLYRQLLRTGFKPPDTLRHGLCAGEAMSPVIPGAFGVPVYEAFGLSECSTFISSSPTVPMKPGSPGRPQPGRRVKILDDGRLAIHRSDPGLMLGYWNSGGDTGDWFATGDLGRFDDDGYFWHEGRADDLMNALGYRVSPLEVESVLLAHPGVAEAAVAEVRLRDDLSIIAAFIVPRDGAALETAALARFAGERLAGYKLPKEMRLVKSLPRSATGKLLRRALTLD